jgi:hypothetical protein
MRAERSLIFFFSLCLFFSFFGVQVASAQNGDAAVSPIQGWRVYGNPNSVYLNPDLASVFANGPIHPDPETACQVAAGYLVDSSVGHTSMYSWAQSHTPTL